MVGRGGARPGHDVAVGDGDPELDRAPDSRLRLQRAELPFKPARHRLSRVLAEVELDRFFFALVHGEMQCGLGDAEVVLGLERDPQGCLGGGHFFPPLGDDDLHRGFAVGKQVDAIENALAGFDAVAADQADGKAGQILGRNFDFAAEQGGIFGVNPHRHLPVQPFKPEGRLADSHACLDGQIQPAPGEQGQVADLALDGRSLHVSRINLLARDVRHRRPLESFHLVGERSRIAQFHDIAERLLRAADDGAEVFPLLRVRHESELALLSCGVRGDDPSLRRDDSPCRHLDLQVLSDADVLRSRHAHQVGPARKRDVEEHGALEKEDARSATKIEQRACRGDDARASRDDAPEPPGFHHVPEVERIRQHRGLNQQRPHQRGRAPPRVPRKLDRGDEAGAECRQRMFDQQGDSIVVQPFAKRPDGFSPQQKSGRAKASQKHQRARRPRQVDQPV